MRRLRVVEVSLAKYPKNRRKFLVVKEGDMEKLAKVVAFLAAKADVPEVVKEELKDFYGELNEEELLEGLAEAGIEIKKAEDDGMEKIEKEYKERMEKIEKEYKEKLMEMEKQLLKKELEEIAGEDVAEEILPLVGKISKEEALAIARKFQGLKKMADDLGKRAGSNDDKGDNTTDSEVMEKAKKLAEERNIPLGDALVELAKEEPDTIANWR